MIGTLLANRYRIDAPLGEGGMGVVYRAHDALLDRAVASEPFSRKDACQDAHCAIQCGQKDSVPTGVRVAMGTTVAWR